MLGSESEVSPSVPHLEDIRFNEEMEQRVASHAYTHMILVGTTTQICSSIFSFPVVRVTFNHSPKISGPSLIQALICHTGSSWEPRQPAPGTVGRIPWGLRLCLLPREHAPWRIPATAHLVWIYSLTAWTQPADVAEAKSSFTRPLSGSLPGFWLNPIRMLSESFSQGSAVVFSHFSSRRAWLHVSVNGNTLNIVTGVILSVGPG